MPTTSINSTNISPHEVPRPTMPIYLNFSYERAQSSTASSYFPARLTGTTQKGNPKDRPLPNPPRLPVHSVPRPNNLPKQTLTLLLLPAKAILPVTPPIRLTVPFTVTLQFVHLSTLRLPLLLLKVTTCLGGTRKQLVVPRRLIVPPSFAPMTLTIRYGVV